MADIIIRNYKSPFGELIIGDYNGALCLLDWRYRKMRESIDSRVSKGLNAKYVNGNTPLIDKTINQLNQYALGNLKAFDLPIELVGSDFQKQVWLKLMHIPYGETRSYLQLSRWLGNEKAVRAVATANGANCISIIVPCHRIIGANGELVGYAGGIGAKKKLLELERNDLYKQSVLFD
ncbi:MAG: methylated-DNA--[protein]-cysteine S-methyltransferase [Bacteroidia bacterium]